MQDLEHKRDAASDAAEADRRDGAEATKPQGDIARETGHPLEEQELLELGTYFSPDDFVEDPAPGIEQAQFDEAQAGEEQRTEAAREQAGDEASDEQSEEQASIIFEQAIEDTVDEEAHARLKATIEAAIYITDEPLTPDQIARAVEQPIEVVKQILAQLAEEYARPDRGLSVRELAGGYKMGTKPEHHESIRLFVKRLQPPFKLSLAALETLAVIAYKQPITSPEVMEIRGVQGAGVLKTLLDRRLIATAGRKDVVGKPIMYKTTKEFLIQFGLSSLGELPTLKEFEELGRMAMGDEEPGELEGEAGRGRPARSGGAAVQDDWGQVMENTEGHSEELPQEIPQESGSKDEV